MLHGNVPQNLHDLGEERVGNIVAIKSALLALDPEFHIDNPCMLLYFHDAK